ncbi:MAG: guanosine-3',5'-bis(diphosphate) 3'-pyrophosphohydrolase, partial [Azoarcus sp.]|nr:guanosine-3',5'-bis(diphosphate) 3'-pyrophosphohydrolase [Azoarcus sp.]
RFLRDRGVRIKKDIFADIGLGKRLPVIVARRLAQAQDQESGRPDVVKPKPAGAIQIRGSEGVAVQLARCCQPIPGDPIIGTIRKGQGLEVHLHDCPVVAKLRGDRARWVDVEWEPSDGRLFDVTIRVLSKNSRGVLARVASAISEEDCNIQTVNMDNEQGDYTALNLTVQVRDRMHLARVMRAVRRVPEVVRIGRLKADGRV